MRFMDKKYLDYINNIVFYETKDTKEKRARIFFKGKGVRDVSYDEAIDLCLEIANELGLKSIGEFKKLVNNKIIHVTTEKSLQDNIDFYQKEISFSVDDDTIEDVSNVDFDDEMSDDAELETEDETVEEEIDKDVNDFEDDNYDIDNSEDLADEDDFVDISDPNFNVTYEPNKKTSNLSESSEEEDNSKKKGFFGRLVDKIKKNKIVKRIVLCVTALAVGLGIYSCASRKSLEGKMANSNLTSISDTNRNSGNDKEQEDLLFIGDNSYYNDYSYDTLLKVNSNDTQKNAMKNTFEMLKSFNGDFANAYVEKGSKIKPALSFDEMLALQTAYNDYSKEQIKAIFNGAEIRSKDMENNYKAASLQLMGAYVIETKEHPVNMASLIDSKDGKDFYDRYHKQFMKAKYATGDEQLKAVKDFYDMVRKDFPITNKERTEGISHADSHNSIEAYKLSVTPMIAASEMIFQNLKVDNTLKDYEIDFLNDIGLCNYAKDSFNRVETVLLVSDANKEEPLSEQYKNQIVKMMKDKNSYVIDDAHRELSKLKVFQLAVNGHFDQVISGDFNCTKTVVSTYTDSSVSYSEKIERKELPITDEAKAKIDAQVASENAKAKSEGERKAEQNRKSMQDAEDKNAAKVREEVKADDKDMQDKIDQANEDISKGKPVNESDFGDHGVDFDDDHSDEHGNLDDSVDGITTDGRGADNGALPDPNETGKKFDSASVGASNEAFADSYVEYIAETSASETENGYQYVK